MWNSDIFVGPLFAINIYTNYQIGLANNSILKKLSVEIISGWAREPGPKAI